MAIILSVPSALKVVCPRDRPPRDLGSIVKCSSGAHSQHRIAVLWKATDLDAGATCYCGIA